MRSHRCYVCKTKGKWTKDWQNWGSILIEEEGLPVLMTCSQKCRDKIKNPAIELLKHWNSLGARPSKAVLKTFKQYPEECKPFM